MKNDRLVCVFLAIVIKLVIVTEKALSDDERLLGHFPLCEASSALILTCPDGQGNCLLVGDNEQKNDLFLFTLKDSNIDISSRQEKLSLLSNGDSAIADIEAISQTASDTILIFGSHSRNTKCETKKKRRRFAEVKLSGRGVEVVRLIKSRKIKCERLFGETPLNDEVVKAACDVIDGAEERARKIENDLENGLITEEQAKEHCNAALPFNAEGVAAILNRGGTEVWLGLRAPLLPKHPGQPERKKLAMLLRLKNLERYQFDRVALLDMGGRGIRELTVADNTVWLIAGPPEDRPEPFELRSFPKSALNSKEVIEPDLVETLPTSSEGLALKGGHVYVVIDGDTGDNEASQRCREPGKYKIISLP